MINVQIKALRIGAIIPEYKSKLAAGLDLAACINEPITLYPGEKSVLIPSGLAAYVGDAYYAYVILPRSGLGHKQGLVLGNGLGLIDADYQGEIMVSACVRPGHDPLTINPGDRIAQIMFIPIERVSWEHVADFHEVSARAANGFGSSGV